MHLIGSSSQCRLLCRISVLEVDMEEAAESGDLEGPTLVEKAMAGAANSIQCLASTTTAEEKESDTKSCVEDPAGPGNGSAPDILVGVRVEPRLEARQERGRER